MAKQTYTEEDKKAFRLKDMMNCRQSALKAASINNESKGISSKDMIAEAQEYYDWLYPDAVGDTAASPSAASNVSLPTPTATQQKVLEKIASELKVNVKTIKSKVLDIAEDDYNVRKYPENLNSVSHFVNKLK